MPDPFPKIKVKVSAFFIFINGPNNMLYSNLVTFIFRIIYLHCSGFLMNVVVEYHKDKLRDAP